MIFFVGPANFRKIAGEILSEFDGDFFCEFFGLVFPGYQAPPKNSRPNSRQNCRHSSPISLSRTQFFQVGMNGFPTRAPQECSKKFAATFLKGNSLPEEMFLEYSFCS